MTIIDSHCHLNFPEYKDDQENIIADCLKKGIGLINIGTSLKTSTEVFNLANQYPNKPIYAAIGLYPSHCSDTDYDAHEQALKDPDIFFNPALYQKLIDADINKKIVAVGEIGLEYSYVPSGRDLAEIKSLQRQGFIDQLNFAGKNNLPVILHARGSKEKPDDAYEDMLEILTAFLSSSRKRGSHGLGDETQDSRWSLPRTAIRGGNDSNLKGVLHCFSSTIEIAQKFLDLGFYLGFTGIITFKNKSVDNLRKVVKLISLEKILVETDAPYLTPEPHRGEINKPQNVTLVAQKIAELKNISYGEVCKITTNNVKNLFLCFNV
ncbi:MAG TPA: TatD family hydrolase [bacterium]|nr:TatD family hydrolase [bacterium]